MHELTRQTLLKLQKKTSRILTVEDFVLVSELDALAKAVNGVNAIERRLLRSPYSLCGVAFYPLTVAKAMWFEEKVEEWEITGTKQDALIFWLLTLPLNSEVFDCFAEYKAVNKAIKKLNRKLHCSNAELADVYEKCVGKSEGNGNGNDISYGGLVACLIKEYGGDPDKWLYETPIDMISSLFSDLSERNAVESKRATTSGKAVAPPPTPHIIALAKFREKTNLIEAIWSESNE